MPPAQPAGAPNANSSHNPYEFIVADTQPRQTGKFSFGGSKAMKLLAIVLGVGVLLVIGGLVFTNLAPKNSAETRYVTLVQDQQEVIRVATQGNIATTEEARALATNTQLSISSDQKTLLNYLSKSGVKVEKKQLELKRDSTVDTTLLSAKATNTYDSALTSALVTELKAYMSDIQAAYKQTSGDSAKRMLVEEYAHAKLLLKQAGADTTTAKP